jgi:hypothetical protein
MESVIRIGNEGFKDAVYFTRIDDKFYLSITDFIMGVCKKTSKEKALVIWLDWRATCSDEQRESLLSSTYIKTHKFKERGEKEEVIELEGALKLIMWLPGKYAKVNRNKYVKILPEYFFGLLKSLDQDFLLTNLDEDVLTKSLAQDFLLTNLDQEPKSLDQDFLAKSLTETLGSGLGKRKTAPILSDIQGVEKQAAAMTKHNNNSSHKKPKEEKYFGKVPQNSKELLYRFLSGFINARRGYKNITISQNALYEEFLNFVSYHEFPWSMVKYQFAKHLGGVGGISKLGRVGSCIEYELSYSLMTIYLQGEGEFDSKI